MLYTINLILIIMIQKRVTGLRPVIGLKLALRAGPCHGQMGLCACQVLHIVKLQLGV